MPKTIKEERLRWIMPIANREIKLVDAAKMCPHSQRSTDFLEEVIGLAPFRIRAVKTDNGSNFTNRHAGYLKSSDPMNLRLHDFDLLCQEYNDTEHCGLNGKTPNEMLTLLSINEPTNVCG